MDEQMNNETPPSEEQPQQEPSAPESQPEQSVPQPVMAEDKPKDAVNMAMLCHLLAIFTGFLGPLILWLVKKDEHPYIDEQGKEALNFQISVLIASFVGGILTFVCIGFVILAAVGIGNLVFCILACIATSKGEDYRYPFTLRLVK